MLVTMLNIFHHFSSSHCMTTVHLVVHKEPDKNLASRRETSSSPMAMFDPMAITLEKLVLRLFTHSNYKKPN